MTNRDFKFWLHGWMEIGGADKFTPGIICIIRDHIGIVENPDDFVIWLRGVLDVAPIFGFEKNPKLFDIVNQTLNQFFAKETPDRKKELKKACDSIKSPIVVELDKKVNDLLDDMEKGLPLRKVTTPLVVGPVPQPYHVDGYVRPLDNEFQVYCSNGKVC